MTPEGGGLALARPLRSQEGAPVVEKSVPLAAAPAPATAARAASVTSAASAIADGARPKGATSAALPARSRLPLILVGGALIFVVSVGAGLAVFSGGQDDAVIEKKELDATAKYAAFLRHYRFGGRHLDWWSARLTELAPGGAAQDAKLFTLTKDRAQRLGLVLDEQPGRVDVQLSEPLAARLLERLEVR